MGTSSGGFGHDALNKYLGSTSSGGSGFKHETIPSASIPSSARFCIAFAATPSQVASLIAGVSDSRGFKVSIKTDERVEVHTGIMVDYKYEFVLKSSPRGTDVFLYFGEAKFGWGPVQIANHQRNISELTKAIELRAPERHIHVSSPSSWIRPLYKGAGGYVAKAAGQTAKNAVFGCFFGGLFLLVGLIALVAWVNMQSSPSRTGDSRSGSSILPSLTTGDYTDTADNFMEHLAAGEIDDALKLCDRYTVDKADLVAIHQNPAFSDLFRNWQGQEFQPKSMDGSRVQSNVTIVRTLASPVGKTGVKIHYSLRSDGDGWLVNGFKIEQTE